MACYEKGDHLWVTLTYEDAVPFTHHGLYVGNGKVIERCQNGVKLSTLHEFSEGNEIHVEEHFLRPFTRDQSCERAYSQLNDSSYNLVFNNCEAFVSWCINGVKASAQVGFVAGVAAACHPVTRIAGAVVGGTVAGNFASTKIPKSVIKAVSENPIMQNEITQTTAENPKTAAVGGALGAFGSFCALTGVIIGSPAAVGLSIMGTAAVGGGYLASKIKKWIFD